MSDAPKDKPAAPPPRRIPIHKLAMRLKEQHAGKTAILVDLSGIPNIHNRIMFRSMARFIEERTIDESVDAVPLARNMLVMLAPPDIAQRLRSRLEALSGQLQEQHRGSIRLRLFDLDIQAEKFAEVARDLMEQSPAPGSERAIAIRDVAPPDVDALSQIIDLHGMLWQADLSSQTRRQVIWQLRRGSDVIALAEELWISISAIEQATGVVLRDNVWLFGKATELLDQRMLAQLMAETDSLTYPLSINLHLTTVISTAFRRFAEDKPATQVGQVIVEIPLLEWHVNHTLSEAALGVLRQHGLHLSLDGIRPEDLAVLTDADWQVADYLKIDVAGGLTPAQAAALQALPPARLELLRAKGVFMHCDDGTVVEAGIAAGIQYFQGRGLTPLLEDAETLTRLLGAGEAGPAA